MGWWLVVIGWGRFMCFSDWVIGAGSGWLFPRFRYCTYDASTGSGRGVTSWLWNIETFHLVSRPSCVE